MIISIRGTSGAGKSTIVNHVMETYPGTFNRIMSIGRKRPMALLAQQSKCHECWGTGLVEIQQGHTPMRQRTACPICKGKPSRSLFIVGHYDIPCGGADTISGNDIIYGMVREAADAGHDVIFEGRIIGVDVNRTIELAKKYPVGVYYIDISLEECLASINVRRRAKNPDATDVNPKNTTNIYKQIPRSMDRLRNANVPCFEGDRAEIEAMIKEAVGCRAIT